MNTINKCGECMACCDILPVKELKKDANENCTHCGIGCLIYDTRPQECALFECAYYQTDAPLDLRPDKCGVIFEKLSDRIFYGTVFKTATEQGVSQAHAFVAQGFSVVLASNTAKWRPRVYIAPGHDEMEIRAEFTSHVEASL